ncbi:MAG: hypothetical protein FWF92_00560 [Oscillospiraceae bacterium]|nr:hypothetical protein [Oscillospiraceae bacterium]
MAENKKITLELADGTKFEIESFNGNDNYEVDTDNIFFIIPIKNKITGDLVKKITPENMARISVLADSKVIDEIEGYSKLLSVDKAIDCYRQTITVRAAMTQAAE